MNSVAVNTYQIQGALGATLTETSWLVAAYMAPNVSMTLLLTKVRTQIGLRRFAEIAIALYGLTTLLHLVITDFWSALPVRFLAGLAGAPISTLGFLYMLEAFPPARKMSWGLSLALACLAANPFLARLVSPTLLDLGQYRQLNIMELGLATLAFAAVYLLPLTPPPRANVLHRRDFITFPLIAIGFGLLAVALALGRLYWWIDAPLIGVAIAAAVACLGLAGALEVNRPTPLVDVRWLLSPEILHLTAVLILFRIILSEQSSGAIGLFQTLGLLNEQSAGFYWLLVSASVAGGVLCGAILKPERVPALHALALACIAAGAFMDGQATSLTRPADMYVSQALVAFGGALFLPPALVVGLGKAMARGPTMITSFIVVFLFTQSLGGLVGSALFGTFVTAREKLHSNYLVEHVVLTNPIVADRVRQLAAAYGRVLTDTQLLNAEGLSLLSGQATREANVLAYNDAFLLIAVISTAALLGLLAHQAWRFIRPRGWSSSQLA